MWNFHQGIPSFHMSDFYIVFIGKIKTGTNRYVCRHHLFVIANDMQLKINIPEANEILTTAPHPAVATIVSLRYIRKFEPTYGTLWIRNFHYATANLPTSHQTSVTFHYATETSVATLAEVSQSSVKDYATPHWMYKAWFWTYKAWFWTYIYCTFRTKLSKHVLILFLGLISYQRYRYMI